MQIQEDVDKIRESKVAEDWGQQTFRQTRMKSVSNTNSQYKRAQVQT